MGLKTWFDNENMQGDVKKAMAKGIAESAVVLCFLTDSYITKASGLGPEGEVSRGARTVSSQELVCVRARCAGRQLQL